MKRHFARLRAEHDTFRLDEVTDVHHLVEEIKTFLANIVGAEEQLYLARAIFDVRERNLAHRAAGTDSPRKGHFDLSAFALFGFELGDRLCTHVSALCACGVSLHAFGAKFFEFLQTDFLKCIVISHICFLISTRPVPRWYKKITPRPFTGTRG